MLASFRSSPVSTSHPLLDAYHSVVSTVLAVHGRAGGLDRDELRQRFALRILELIDRGCVLPENPRAYAKRIGHFVAREMMRQRRSDARLALESELAEGVFEGFAPEPGTAGALSPEEYAEQREALARALQGATPGEADAVCRRLLGQGPPAGGTEGAQNVLVCRLKKRLAPT